MPKTFASRVMAALPPPGEPVTIADAAGIAGLDRKGVARSLCQLLERGMVERIGRATYRLTAAGRTARGDGTVSKPGPRGGLTGRRGAPAGALRPKIWAALRMMDKPTIPDLMTLTGAGKSPNNTRQYLQALERAGFVARMARRAWAPRGRGHVRWIVINNTGPRAPVWRRRRDEIYDPNTGKIHNLGENPNG